MNIVRLLVVMLGILPALPLQAAETWYEVEVIVLAQRNPDAGSEIWPAKSLPVTPLDTALAIPDPLQAVATDPRIAALPSENYRLQAEAQRIAQDGNYELLLHTGWRQAGLAREQSVPLRLHAVAPMPADEASGSTGEAVQASAQATRLDGTLRLILARYLHLETDLQYHEETPQGQGFFSLFAPDQADKPVYRLNETRRMRSRELHYLDHPMFGVIALVTPYEVPAAAAPAPRPAPPAPAPVPATGTSGTIKRN